MVPAHLVDLVVLEDRRVRAACAVDLHIENRVESGRARQGTPKLPLLDGERHRLTAAVQDARDEAAGSQAPRLARSETVALVDAQLGALSGHSGGGV